MKAENAQKSDESRYRAAHCHEYRVAVVGPDDGYHIQPERDELDDQGRILECAQESAPDKRKHPALVTEVKGP